MKNSIIYLFFIILILLFTCKKVESETNKINSDKNVTNDINISSQNKTKLKELITALGGRMFKENVSMLDAEILNLDEKSSKLSDYKNKVIMLNLWATWCPPCREEMPSMQNLYDN